MSSSARDLAVEAMLADAVHSTTRPRRERRRWIFSIGSFAIAGALAGSLTAGAIALPSAAATRLQSDMRNFAFAQTWGGTMLGDSLFVQGSGDETLALPPRPADADQLVVSYWCRSGTSVVADTSAGHLIPSRCDDGRPPQTPRSYSSTAPDTASLPKTVDVAGDAAFAVFASWYRSAPVAKASAAQQAATADGTVTRQEYLDGIQRLDGCMAQAGYPTNPPNPDRIENSYGTSAAGQFVFDHDCYPREFQDIDTLWQGQVATRSMACLAAVGVQPIEGEDWQLQLEAHHLTPEQCGIY